MNIEQIHKQVPRTQVDLVASRLNEYQRGHSGGTIHMGSFISIVLSSISHLSNSENQQARYNSAQGRDDKPIDTTVQLKGSYPQSNSVQSVCLLVYDVYVSTQLLSTACFILYLKHSSTDWTGAIRTKASRRHVVVTSPTTTRSGNGDLPHSDQSYK